MILGEGMFVFARTRTSKTEQERKIGQKEDVRPKGSNKLRDRRIHLRSLRDH